MLLLVVIDVVCKEECAGLDGALSFTYYGERNPYPGSTSTDGCGIRLGNVRIQVNR